MRIAIVNDMPLAVEAMRRILVRAGHEVIWIARNGHDAVERCQRDLPDLILMDVVMPELDGVEATRRIMARTPCAIIIVTANVADSTSRVFEAMGAGARDAVNTPTLGEPGNLDGGKALLAKIETIRKLIGPTDGRKSDTPAAPAARPPEFKHDRLVAIGASAGGPAAVSKLLAALPADFPAAIVVVQHVDPQFAHGLTDWLRSHTQLQVRLVEEGDRPRAGTVFLAGRENHLILASPTHLGYTRHPVESSYHPSVDVFFKSVSRMWPGLAVGVLLTGMGRDGAAGLKALREAGHHTIAQDQATSAVYGMPKAAAEMNAATEILALDKIAPRLTNILTRDSSALTPKQTHHARRTT